MRKVLILVAAVLAGCSAAWAQYVPSAGNLSAREAFSQKRLGIFLHWGIYSSYAQGEWYLSTHQLDPVAYSEAAAGFCPSAFDAAEWAEAFQEAGAGYVTLTSRHHDGFSMFRTAASAFNVVDATPCGRDLLGELTAAVKARGLRMQYYYSLIDWIRPDYPKGSSGVAKDASKADYDHYFAFEKAQIRELLAYRPGALWFDGLWDQDPAFSWRMEELYAFIHGIDPDCLIGNNHHRAPIEGEDFQMFERDLPGENNAGFSEGQAVSRELPLEMCQTMNGAWGYRVEDQDYKSVKELVHLLVRAAAKGANLLLNIGPQANGKLPEAALERLRGIGAWMQENRYAVDGCGATGIPEQAWGVTTGAPGHIYLHILDPSKLSVREGMATIILPLDRKVRTVAGAASWKMAKDKSLTITLPTPDPAAIDTILDIVLR